MYGAIIGDIAGSYYEVLEINALRNSESKKRNYKDRIKIMDRTTPLFHELSSYTDDTVLTVAIADALLNDKDYSKYLKEYGLKEMNLGLDKYGRSRFGNGFISWLNDEKEGNSYGNGSSMRVSPVGFYFNSIDDVIMEAYQSAKPSHNSPSGKQCAAATASSIFLARTKHSKNEIKKFIENRFSISLDYNIEYLRNNYTFKADSIGSVPIALYAFLESDSFEDTIRKSISVGGDSDTIAAIAGSIAEAYYGINDELINEVNKYIPLEYKMVIDKFYKKIGEK